MILMQSSKSIVVILCYLFCKGVYSQSTLPPYWVASSVATKFLPEDTQNGTCIASIKATGRNGVNVHIERLDTTTKQRVSMNCTEGLTTVCDVRLEEELDRDTGVSEWNLFFRAYDEKIKIDQVPDQILKIIILDVNDTPPKFKVPFYQANVKEDAHKNKDILNVTAEDPDNGAGGVVQYSLQPSGQSSDLYQDTFKIDSSTGVITLNGILDYRTLSFYQYDVIANDKGNPSLNGTASLVIKVIDIQNTPPYFQGLPYVTNIPENSPNNTKISIVALAFDGDTGIPNSILYSFPNDTEACHNLFQVNSASGVITSKNSLDRDTTPITDVGGICRLTLEARETNSSGQEQKGNSSTTTTVVITVDDQNDNEPVFSQTFYNASVLEGISSIPVTIMDPNGIVVWDIDQGPNNEFKLSVHYLNGTLSSDIEAVPANVNGNGSILLRLNKEFDYEEQHNISYRIIAKEPAKGQPFSNATVLIHILDANDNDPQFTATSFSAYATENQTSSESIINITATDEDSGKFGTVTYRLSGDDHFQVNNVTGEISTVIKDGIKRLDREKRDEYFLTLEAKDGGGRRNAVGVTIYIKDINDNAPQFQQSSYNFLATENDKSKGNFEIIAVDNDQANLSNSEITYSLQSPLLLSNISIDEKNGTLRINYPLDYEALPNNTKGILELVVNATDGGTPKLDSSIIVQIHVEDINDNTPTFYYDSYTGTISEYPTAGDSVTNVSASDADGTVTNSKVTYYIEKGGKDKFRINGETGEITVDMNPKFDRETDAVYNLTILAVDRGTPPLTGTAMVYVYIKDVNDEIPELNQSTYEASINESASINAFVIACPATDRDENSSLVYSISCKRAIYNSRVGTCSSVEDYFMINNTGEIRVKSKLDRETATSVTLTVNVTDAYGSIRTPQTDTADVIIKIEDANDNKPVFVKPPDPIEITEGRFSGKLLTLTATDADLNNVLTYSIIVNPLEGFWVNTATGDISRKNDTNIDREKNKTLLMVVSVDDGLHTANESINISVQDVNDNAPQFSFPTYTTNITENNGTDEYNNTFVYSLEATDLDLGPNANITYHINGGNIKNVFRFENETIGNITVSGNLDRENIQQYILTIEARDNPTEKIQQRTGTTSLTVNILDLNDNPPIFSPKVYKETIQEDININRVVLTVTATDADFGQNSNFSYYFAPDNSNFSIDTENGNIAVKSSLKNKYGTHILTVVAEDYGLGNLRSSANVTIEVNDVNDHDPRFINLQNFYKVYECARIGTIVASLTAVDEDHGDNSRIEYKLVEQTGEFNQSDFSLDNITGVLKTITNPLDAAIIQYKIRVLARDHGNPPRSSPAHDILITVVDVNDHPPEFLTNISKTSVSENTANISIFVAKAYDKDTNSIIRYSIEPTTNVNNIFEINPENGTIIITKEIDREKTPNVTITIRAVDITARNISTDCDKEEHSLFSNTTIMDVFIKILDENDNAPEFKSKILDRGVRRNVKLQSVIMDFKENVRPDPDEAVNAIHMFSFHGSFNYSTQTLKNQITRTVGQCPDKSSNPICLSSNGTLSTNILFEENMMGYIIIPVKAEDAAGNSTATLTLYIISDAQTAAMLIYDNKHFVQKNQAVILKTLSDNTGHEFVADGIESYVQNGIADAFRTYLYFHVVKDGKVNSATEAKRIFDMNAAKLLAILDRYKISSVTEYLNTLDSKADDGIKTTFIMIGIIALLGVIVLVLGFFYCNSVSKYQRKLKAATTKTTVDTDVKESHPGTNVYARNQNPLLNKDEELNNVDYNRFDDNVSIASYDSNQFEKKEPVRGDEEKGATMDMYEEEVQMSDEADALAMVLQQHKREKAASRESLIGHVNHEDIEHSFVHSGYEHELETTEV